VRRVSLLLLLALSALALGCGDSSDSPGSSSGPVIEGRGIVASDPPWKPEYAHLQERMKSFGVPPPGTEKYHHHAQLHVYADGLLVPVPTHIGIAPDVGITPAVVAGLHTHAPGGVIHIEATKPFKATLGDFFAIWGVAFGPEQVGSLKNDGDRRVYVLANGRPVADPIDYVMKEGDNLVVAYGKPGSFPKKPDVSLLRDEQAGRGAGGCGARQKGEKKPKSCVPK
jgi:hypothetical protein